MRPMKFGFGQPVRRVEDCLLYTSKVRNRRGDGGQGKSLLLRPVTVVKSGSGIGLEPGCRDAGAGRGLVIVGGVAGDADRAEQRAFGRADQNAAGNRHQRAANGMGRRIDEIRTVQRLSLIHI